MKKNNYRMDPKRAAKILQMPRDWFNTTEKILLYNKARHVAIEEFKGLWNSYKILQDAVISEQLLSENDEFVEEISCSYEQVKDYMKSKKEAIEDKKHAEKEYERESKIFFDIFGESVLEKFNKNEIVDLFPDRMRRIEREKLKNTKNIDNYKTSSLDEER